MLAALCIALPAFIVGALAGAAVVDFFHTSGE